MAEEPKATKHTNLNYISRKRTQLRKSPIVRPSFLGTVAKAVEDSYSFDIFAKAGPYRALVLRVDDKVAPPPKVKKEKVVIGKPIKAPKEKVVKKIKEPNALDILMDIKTGKIPVPKVKKRTRNLELEIKQLIDTITESIESSKMEETDISDIFIQ